MRARREVPVPKWKKDATVFPVSVNADGNGGNICRIPKPVIELLGITNCVEFVIDGDVYVKKGERARPK